MTGTIDGMNDKEYRAVKRLYIKSLKEKKESFEYNDSVLLVKFAKYMLQYIEEERSKRGLRIFRLNDKDNFVEVKLNNNYKSKDEVW